MALADEPSAHRLSGSVSRVGSRRAFFAANTPDHTAGKSSGIDMSVFYMLMAACVPWGACRCFVATFAYPARFILSSRVINCMGLGAHSPAGRSPMHVSGEPRRLISGCFFFKCLTPLPACVFSLQQRQAARITTAWRPQGPLSRPWCRVYSPGPTLKQLAYDQTNPAFQW